MPDNLIWQSLAMVPAKENDVFALAAASCSYGLHFR
jgi:hypothetical protein